MRSATRTFSYYFIGTVISVFAFLFVIEITTRTVSWARGDGFGLALHERDATDESITQIYQFHPFAGFTFKPNQVFRAGHPAQVGLVEIRIDENGFLSNGNPLSLAKAPDEIRIATIGASTTANLNLSFDENWPGKLRQMLQESYPENPVSIINAAIPGFNSAQSIGNLILRVLPYSPDVVIIYHGYNDLKIVRPGFNIKPDYSNVHERPHGTHERPTMIFRLLGNSMFFVRTRNRYREFKQTTASVDAVAGRNRLDRVPDDASTIFAHNITMMVAAAQGAGAKVILSSFATLHDITKPPPSEVTGLSDMEARELYGLLNFTPGLTLDGIFDGLRRYNEVLKSIAEREQTGWVDNSAMVPHEEQYFVDRVHFSAAGAARMADNFFPAVMESLRDLGR